MTRKKSRRSQALLLCALVCSFARCAQPYQPSIHRDGAPRELSTETVRAALDAWASRAAAAGLAGNAAHFLALTAPAEDEHRHELAEFAADLAKVAPEKLECEVSNPVIHGDRVRADLTLRWKMPKMMPREVSFPARFVIPHADREALFAGEAWERREAPGVVAHHFEPDSDCADAVLTSFALVREGVERFLDVPRGAMAGRSVRVKIYPSMVHLQSSIYLSYARPLGGWNEPGESIKVLRRIDPNPDSYAVVLAHEYAHALTFSMGPKATNMPWWALEGIAEMASVPHTPGHTERAVARCRTWARKGELVEFSQLCDFATVPERLAGHVYDQGHAMAAYITGRFGAARRNVWLHALAQGQTLEVACTQALGTAFAQIDSDWRAMLVHDDQSKEE